MKTTFFPALLTLALASMALAEDNHVETGLVNWSRDFDASLAKSRESGKPVFALFQEVPGCSGCQKFGREVLSNPLLVEAIETEFVPTVIYNNRQGYDAKILSKYGEPAWNYQVIRFLNNKGDDIISRKDRVWALSGVASRMTQALEEADNSVPRYLEAVALENDTDQHGQAAFAMTCFWTGEMRLGQIPGVIRTEAGWLEGREVTLVTYHKGVLSLEELAEAAAKVECARKVYAPTQAAAEALKAKTRLATGLLSPTYRPASSSDQKKQIEGTVYASKQLKLTSMQQTKVNAFARQNPREALTWLSPRQAATLRSLTN